MGKGERDSNKHSGALNTTDTLIKDLGNFDIVMHIGDMSYANGYISQWDQFLAQMEPITSKVPYMVARSITFSTLFKRFGPITLQLFKKVLFLQWKS